MAIELGKIRDAAKSGVEKFDPKGKAAAAGGLIMDKASAVKDSVAVIKEDIEEKLTELDRMLAQCITDYNDSFTIMNDRGVQLFVERTRAADLIAFTESLVNSIANRPKSFESDFEEIAACRSSFTDSCTFAERELQAAREAAGGAGAGLAAGASVAFMAPTAAMWVATTFGTASTGVAISTLSGAAAESAALAWLGGGAVAAGGGGMAAGNALLALAGPVGWTIAGATLMTSIVVFANKRTKLNKQKNEEIEEVKRNTEKVKEVDAKIVSILEKTSALLGGLTESYRDCQGMYARDYSSFTDEEKKRLGALVNHTKALSVLFTETVEG